jgi:hypothetical protein
VNLTNFPLVKQQWSVTWEKEQRCYAVYVTSLKYMVKCRSDHCRFHNWSKELNWVSNQKMWVCAVLCLSERRTLAVPERMGVDRKIHVVYSSDPSSQTGYWEPTDSLYTKSIQMTKLRLDSTPVWLRLGITPVVKVRHYPFVVKVRQYSCVVKVRHYACGVKIRH